MSHSASDKITPFQLTLKEFQQRDIHRLFSFVQQHINFAGKFAPVESEMDEKTNAAMKKEINSILSTYKDDPKRAENEVDALIANFTTTYVEPARDTQAILTLTKKLLPHIVLVGDKKLFDPTILDFMLQAIVTAIARGEKEQECLEKILKAHPSTAEIPTITITLDKDPTRPRLEFKKGLEHASLFDAVYSFVTQKLHGITLIGSNSIYNQINVQQLATAIANEIDLTSEPSIKKDTLVLIIAHIIDSYEQLATVSECKLPLQKMLVDFIRSSEKTNFEAETVMALMNIHSDDFIKLRKEFKDKNKSDDELLQIIIAREKNKSSALKIPSTLFTKASTSAQDVKKEVPAVGNRPKTG